MMWYSSKANPPASDCKSSYLFLWDCKSQRARPPIGICNSDAINTGDLQSPKHAVEEKRFSMLWFSTVANPPASDYKSSYLFPCDCKSQRARPPIGICNSDVINTGDLQSPKTLWTRKTLFDALIFYSSKSLGVGLQILIFISWWLQIPTGPTAHRNLQFRCH